MNSNIKWFIKNIVWTSVIATSAGAGVFIAAVLNNLTWVVAAGFIGVISAALAARDK